MPTTGTTRRRYLGLHRYVLLIAPIPAIWLLIAILVVWMARRQLFDSISDYYGGPLRDVFVGGLMACGICLIAYKGRSKPEDYALNFAGFNTFLVALVPNSFPDLLARARADEARPAVTEAPALLVTSAELLQNLKIAVAVFLFVALAFAVVDALVMKWERFRWDEQTRFTNVLLCISWIAEIALIGVVVGMLVGAETVVGLSIFSVIHFAAAVLLILNLSFAAATHAFPVLRSENEREDQSRTDVGWFRTATFAMWGGVVVGGIAIARDVPYAVFWTEVWEIVLFLVFWFRAATRDWGAEYVEQARPQPAAASPSTAAAT